MSFIFGGARVCAKIFLLETDVVIFPVIYARLPKKIIVLNNSASRRVLASPYLFFLFLEGSTLPFWAKRGRRKCGDGSCVGSEQI